MTKPKTSPKTVATIIDGVLEKRVFAPLSYDAENDTVNCTLSTGAMGRKFKPQIGEFDEVLSLAEGACDYSRINAGGVFLDDHYQDTDHVLGQVVPNSVIHVPNERIDCRISLIPKGVVQSENVNDKTNLIRTGFLKDVSCGYRWDDAEIIPANKRKDGGKVPLVNVRKWSIYEVSIVSIGFDAQAQIRSLSTESESNSNVQEVQSMENDKLNLETPKENQGEMEARALEASKMAVENERKRTLEIRKLGHDFALETSKVDDLIERGASIQEAKDMVLQMLSAKSAETRINPSHSGFESGPTEVEKRSQAIGQILVEKLTSGKAPSDPQNELRGYSVLELGQEMARLEGRKIGMGQKNDLVSFMLEKRGVGLTSTDFTYALSDALNKSIKVLTPSAPKTFEVWARRNDYRNFQSRKHVSVSMLGGFQKQGQPGSMNNAGASESAETSALASYRMDLPVSRQVLVDDDMGVIAALISSIPVEWDIAQLEAVYGLLQSNPDMADSEKLFSALHGNHSGAAAAPSLTTLSAIYAAMGSQTNADGKKLNLEPSIILVSKSNVANWNAIAQLLEGQFKATASTSATPNYMLGLQIVADSRLGSAEWYAFSNPNMSAVMEFGYLNGQSSPVVALNPVSPSDGISYNCYCDFGCGITDYRGGYKNAASEE